MNERASCMVAEEAPGRTGAIAAYWRGASRLVGMTA